MAAPQLKRSFKKVKRDHLGQIQLTGIISVKNFDTANLGVTNWPNVKGQGKATRFPNT